MVKRFFLTYSEGLASNLKEEHNDLARVSSCPPSVDFKSYRDFVGLTKEKISGFEEFKKFLRGCSRELKKQNAENLYDKLKIIDETRVASKIRGDDSLHFEKDAVYNVYDSYKKHLLDQGKEDVFFPSEDSIKKQLRALEDYGIVVVDEAQDLLGSPLQILFKAGTNNKILFAADDNQTVKTTNRSAIEQLRKMYYDGQRLELNIKKLSIVHRMPENILKITEKLLKLTLMLGGSLSKHSYFKFEPSDDHSSNGSVVYTNDTKTLKSFLKIKNR